MPNQNLMALANALDPRMVAQWMAKFGPGIGRPPAEGPRGQQQGYGRGPGWPPMGNAPPPFEGLPPRGSPGLPADPFIQGMPSGGPLMGGYGVGPDVPSSSGGPPGGVPMPPMGGPPPNPWAGFQQLPSGQYMPNGPQGPFSMAGGGQNVPPQMPPPDIMAGPPPQGPPPMGPKPGRGGPDPWAGYQQLPSGQYMPR